jgi:hypothetical protein
MLNDDATEGKPEPLPIMPARLIDDVGVMNEVITDFVREYEPRSRVIVLSRIIDCAIRLMFDTTSRKKALKPINNPQ